MSPPDRIFALDIATSTGWATLDEHGEVACGHERFDGPLLERLIRLDRWLREGIAELGPALIAHEGQFLRGRNSVTLGAMVQIVKDRAKAERIACLEVGQHAAKLAVGCRNNASKEDVMNAVRALGFVFDGNDEADALAVLIEAARRGERALELPRKAA